MSAEDSEEAGWDSDAKVAEFRECIGDSLLSGWPAGIVTTASSKCQACDGSCTKGASDTSEAGAGDASSRGRCLCFPCGPLGEARTLRRFLRSRKGDTSAALSSLLRHRQWRGEETPDWPLQAISPAEIEECLRSGSAYVRGCDKLGRPTIYVRVRLHVAATERKQMYAYVIHMLDEAVARIAHKLHTHPAPHTLAAEQFSVLLDADGLSWSSFDTDVLKFILKMLSGNYPEHLGCLFIINDGFLFRTLWKVVEPFLDARTARKIKFLGGEDTYRPVLLQHWDSDQLAAAYGGTDPYIYRAEDVLGSPSTHISVQLGPLPAPPVHMHAHGHHHGLHAAHGHHGSHHA